MIRNATIHFNGRLPLLADLRDLPGPGDQSVLATNVRTRDGKRPTFADSIDSWFLIPLREVLTIELPADVLDKASTADGPPAAASAAGSRAGAGKAPPPQDEDEGEAAPESEPATPSDTGPLEPDEDLLARIRQL